MPDINWRKYENFSKWEFDCKHTRKNKMQESFMDILQQIRTTYGKPMSINSGFRDWTHPIERAKIDAGKPVGEHTYGLAADINVSGEDAMALFAVAYGYGIRRLGVYQNNTSKFLHIGMGECLGFKPTIWTP